MRCSGCCLGLGTEMMIIIPISTVKRPLITTCHIVPSWKCHAGRAHSIIIIPSPTSGRPMGRMSDFILLRFSSMYVFEINDRRFYPLSQQAGEKMATRPSSIRPMTVHLPKAGRAV